MTDTITPRRTEAGRPVSGRSMLAVRLVQSIGYDVRLVLVGAQTMADAVLGEDRTAGRREQLVAEAERKSAAKVAMRRKPGAVRDVGSGEGLAPEAVWGPGRGAGVVPGPGLGPGRGAGVVPGPGRGAGVVPGPGRGAGVVPGPGSGVGLAPGVVFGHGVMTAVLGVVSWFLVVLLGMAVVRGAFYGVVTEGPYGAGTWGGPTKAGAWVVHAGVSVPIIVGLLFGFRGIQWLHVASVRRLYGLAERWVLPATIAAGGAGMWLIWAWIQQL
ncbi:hypothetical protein ACWCOV_30170 [Kribbella sp. NPDC002412]